MIRNTNKILFTNGKGAAAVVAMISISIVVIVIGLTIAIKSSIESQSSGRTIFSSQALYGAEAGIEDALSKLNRDATFSTTGAGYDITVGGSSVNVVVDTSGSPKTITATATQRGVTRKVRVSFTITNSTSDATNNTYGVVTVSNWREV